MNRKRNRNNLTIKNMFMYGLLITVTATLGACSGPGKSDAYGQFESNEVRISAEASGKLLQFKLREGETLREGERVGLIDTTGLQLKKEEIQSRIEALRTQFEQIARQVAVLEVELETARKNLKRIRSMEEDGAATPKQLDDAGSRVQSLQKQIRVQQSRTKSVQAEMSVLQKNITQVDKQIRDAVIINPLKGMVLHTYADQFELVQFGQPLYEIADLDSMILRVYISGAQLPAVTLGQQVEVLVDENAEEMQSMNGTVSWIASEAEFTPRMIQTKEERVTQVYAVKISVPNPAGILKIGMPGEVNFSSANQ